MALRAFGLRAETLLMIWENVGGAFGMGSALSGRRSGRPLVEDCLRLDIAQLMRLGPVRDGMVGQGWMEWREAGQLLWGVQIRVDLRDAGKACLLVAFRLAQGEGAGRVVAQRVRLAFTVPNYGGRRWWLICPETGQRVRCLYLPSGGARFASRQALGLAYRVERLGHFDRPFERLHRQRRKLGGEREPMRPKGMWQRSFDTQLARLAALDAACLDAISMKIGAGQPLN
jgi:hypothetical protein